MQKTIIVYSSVDGHTKEICQKIASQLEHQVDIVSVDDNPMVEEYDQIIIGASIRYGKYRQSLFDFIDKNKNTNWIPKKIGVFAGKIDYPKYKLLDKYAIKFIMRITKGPTDTSKTYEFTDWDMVIEFARNI